MVAAPAPGQQLPGTAVAFSGYAPGAVRVEFGEAGAALGTSHVTPEGTWVWESGWAWAEGPHTVECFSVDASGNPSRPVPIAFTVVNVYAVPANGAYLDGRYRRGCAAPHQIGDSRTMSTPASAGAPLSGIETSGTYPVQYRFSHAKKGNQHLVVVFANFAAPDDYGWSNGVFGSLRSNILWIRDQFDGHNSYYLCKGMDFDLERSVVTLISNVMTSLGLTPDQCTMWGGSKGGSAALYFGLKYGFRNIVSIVPQFRIGTYLEKHPKVAEYMMGQVTETNVRILDNVIADLARAGANRGANIYVLSSPQDEQWPVQVEPYLGLFNGYENFNVIFSDSPTFPITPR